MTSGSFWASAPANDNSEAPAPISALAAARKMVLSKPSAGWRIAALLVSVPVNCFVTLKLVAAFPNVESDQAIRGGRVGTLGGSGFPESRENSREFVNFRRFRRFLTLNHAAIPSPWTQFPGRPKQGIFFVGTGNESTRELRLLLPQNRSHYVCLIVDRDHRLYGLSYHNSPPFSRNDAPRFSTKAK